jgi:phage shock protein E
MRKVCYVLPDGSNLFKVKEKRMDQYISVAIIFGVFLVFWMFIKMKKSGTKISPAEAKKMMESEKGTVLIDVRNRDEFINKHIPNSKLMPVGTLEIEAVKSLPNKDSEIIVYCASGSRSLMAARILMKLGYTKVYNLGGIFNWPYETVSGNK